MKKIILFFCIAAFATSFKFPINDCGSMLYFKEGTTTVMTSYNSDGKAIGSNKMMYSKVTKLAGGEMQVDAIQENYNKKGKLDSKNNFTIKCKKGSLLFDMRLMMPAQQQEAYKDMQMEIEGLDKELPYSIKAGDGLKDADVKFKFKTKEGAEVPFGNMEIKITNRKVEGKETITTAAGTFECFKISEMTELKTLFSMKFKSITWFNFESGTIRTESYKESGKFISKSELTEISKQ